MTTDLKLFALDVMDAVVSSPSGGSLSLSGKVPSEGYMVGGVSWSLVAHKEYIDVYTVMDFLTAHATILNWDGMYVGWWEHKGKVHFDIAENFKGRDLAYSMGRSRGEIAVWDLVNETEHVL